MLQEPSLRWWHLGTVESQNPYHLHVRSEDRGSVTTGCLMETVLWWLMRTAVFLMETVAVVANEDSSFAVEKHAASCSCRVRADAHLTGSLASQERWYETLIPEVGAGHS